MQEALSAAQEAEVQELAEAMEQAASAEFLRLARTLVGSGASPCGKTEFAVRDILLKAGARAYEQFNRADLVLVLDFYHAASYLEKPAKALHPRDEKASTSRAEQWRSLLKAEGGALEVFRQWDWPARKSAVRKEQLSAVLEYFGNNVHRMEDPEYLAEGGRSAAG
jgi:hypothetical protein